ncbi:MAG: ABC transporter ATP-binding protein [Bdellovibrio sp.]|nr:ABC transporter ATP-binding protein [Bdellovibrio sp.]
MTTTLLELQNVSKNYGTADDVGSWAVRDVSLTISNKEFTAFAGSSGSGKTTLLNLIGGLDRPTSGHVKLDGTSLEELSSRKLADLRRQKMGFIFQTFNLLPVLSGLENVEYPLLRMGLGAKEIKERSTEAMARVGLTAVMNSRPNQMSGGQRQRVAIARAMVHKPSLILADEPTANLDKKTAADIIGLMKELNRESGVTFVFSTHDPMIMEAATRVLQVSDGQIISDQKRI